MKLKLISTILLSFMCVVSACGSLGRSPQTENPKVVKPSAVAELPSQQEQLPATAKPQAMVMDEPVLTEPPPTESSPTPAPMPTSRGPDLEATNPSAVVLASGNLQLIEFFRFT